MKVLFISSGNKCNEISPIIKSQGDSLINAGIKLDYFLIMKKGFIGYAGAVIKLRHWLKKNPVDLLHAHYGLCGWVAFLARSKKLPLILSYMGSDILPVINGKIAPKTMIARLNRALKNRVDHVIVKSENLKEVLNIKTAISIIPNGVDIRLFKPISKEYCRKMLGLTMDKRMVLFLGDKDDNRKNYQLVKNALNLLDYLDIFIVAPFPIEPEMVPIYINASDLLVAPSISEGSPNVIKEAMACNCPIVATDVGDIKWVIGATEGCFLTNFSTVDMAAKMKQALDFAKRTNGRERIIKISLDQESTAIKIIHVYENVCRA